jgi:hypothetical protein
MAEEPREVLMTLTPSQFAAFASDLRALRDAGAETNTRAILDAVHERAARVTVPPVEERSAA